MYIVRRAQSRINQATLSEEPASRPGGGEEEQASLEGAFIFGERHCLGGAFVIA